MILVDDAPPLRELARLNLELAGFSVVAEARDGAGAPDAVARLQPDVVVLDIDMPGQTGDEVLPDLLAASRGTRVVVWSSVDTGGMAARVLSLGASAFVRKIDDVARLVDAVRAAAADPS